ncbi:MAG: hypothetical protein M1816_003451 [Peltula sp. TS41687]|nr:MAG: hypothetical protein M1816_003451 [Peltula sp. TS41687]
MAYNMDWQTEDYSMYDEEQDPGLNMGGYPGYGGRSYWRPGPQEYLPYDDEPKQYQQWTGSTRPRPLEERITVPSAHIDRQLPLPRSTKFSSNNLNDRAIPYVGERSVTTPASKTATTPGYKNSVGTIGSANSKPADAQHEVSLAATSEKPPDLDYLKARVFASMHRPREENSSTPSKDTAPNTIDPTGAPVTSDLKNELKQLPAKPQAPAVIRGTRSDIDDLLAEGKAAAEAGGKANSQLNIGKEVPPTKPGSYNIDQAASAEKNKVTDDVGKMQNSKTEGADGKEVKTASNGNNRASTGPSEQGEIVEDQEPVKKPPRGGHEEETVKKSPKGGHEEDKKAEMFRGNISSSSKNNTPAQPRHTEEHGSRKKASEKAADPKPKGVTITERRISEPTKYRKESITNPSRNLSLSGRSQMSSDDTAHPREGRPSYPELSIRGYSDVEASPRDVRKTRPIDEAERVQEPRKEYVPRRVIEIDDGDDGGHSSVRVTRAALERKEPGSRLYEQERPRRYEEEQPRKGVIHLSDTYWTDLEDWLDMTGYHDRYYRKDSLQRHKELVALDIRRASLAREATAAQEERAYIARAQSVQPRESLTTGTTRPGVLPQAVRSASVFDMPPPPLPIRENREVLRRIERDDLEAAINVRSESSYLPAASYRDNDLAKVKYIDSPAVYAETGTLKRSYRSDLEDIEQGPSEKLVRVNSIGRGLVRQSDESSHRSRGQLTGEADRRVSGISDSAERRFTNDFSDARDDAGYQRTPREVARRAVSPLTTSGRDRLRSLSPLPRVTSYKEEESKTKVPKPEPSAKTSRAYSQDRSVASKRQEEGDVRPSSRQARYRQDIRDSESERGFKGDTRGSYYARSERPYHQPYSYSTRGRGRGRGNSYHHRGDARTYNHNNQRYVQHHQDMPSRTLDLSKGGVRYFMIKSFNTQNVLKAQEENVWATQEKNGDLFIEAFNTSRHVILFFSINKSMAFQGYARMESAPGTADAPSWTKGLRWKHSGPFHIHWLNVSETRFNRVGHLRNVLNDNHAVLVGRDGQEVEESCGAALCELIDEEGKPSSW